MFHDDPSGHKMYHISICACKKSCVMSRKSREVSLGAGAGAAVTANDLVFYLNSTLHTDVYAHGSSSVCKMLSAMAVPSA